MADYQKWQALVASWGSLYCFGIFAIGVAYALWPPRKPIYDEAALIPLKDD